jgi:hypothetical protein
MQEGRRAMRDAEVDALQDTYDVLFGDQAYIGRNGWKETIVTPVYGEEGPIAGKEVMQIVWAQCRTACTASAATARRAQSRT